MFIKLRVLFDTTKKIYLRIFAPAKKISNEYDIQNWKFKQGFISMK